ncbi:MAG: DnaJ domain-containing protein [Acidobacteria bacterium]|nr:DnaJ domain-containing protein [Acidobacteriota bacterium]
MESRKPSAKDYYSVLGVSPESDSAEIKKAYRMLVQQYHPDRVRGSDEATNASERMIEINEAFSILGDEKRRAELDRKLKAEKAPAAASTESAVEDWEIQVSPMKNRADAPAKRHSAAEKSVAKEFLEKVKVQLMQEGAAAKFKEEGDPAWQWSVLGKTWGALYWVGVRQVSLLNPNAAKELITHLQGLISNRRSGWKSNFFVFIVAFDSLQESDLVLKLFRAFANRSEFSTAKNLVNIIVLDLNQRRSVLCGKRTGDLNYSGILRALGVG